MVSSLSLLVNVIQLVHIQIKLAQSNKEQCQLLGKRLEHLLKILPSNVDEITKMGNQRFSDAITDCYQTAQACLVQINYFVGQKWYRRVSRGGSDNKSFAQLNLKIDQSQLLLTTSLAMNQEIERQKIQEWQQQIAVAQQQDQQELKQRLLQIENLMQAQIEQNISKMPKVERDGLKVSQFQALKNQLQLHAQLRVDPADKVDPKHRLDMADLIFNGLIAKGDFGSVYDGLWQNNYVAIKTINYLTEETRGELIREVQIISRLQHSNVTPFYGACLDQGFECLVMKRMEQGTISSYLAQHPFINFSQQQKLILGLLEGVVYLHSQKIIHRELKADNILIDQDQVYISDFGLAQLKHSISIQSLHTLPTPDISCAPEWIKAQAISDKTDIYSVGWIIWHILSVKPWPRYQINFSKIYPSLNAIPQQYRVLIQQCWNENPNRRPNAQTLLEQAKAIQALSLSALDEIFIQAQTKETNSNYQEAALDYELAARQNHAKSAYALGMLYANARLPINQPAMLFYLTQSANADYYRAQYNLARVYEKGDLAPGNQPLALTFYQKVVDNMQSPSDIIEGAQNKIKILAPALDICIDKEADKNINLVCKK